MHVLTAKGWTDDFVPYYLHDEQVRISVRLWLRVKAIDDAYVRYNSDWRKVLTYARNFGPMPTLKKVISRRSESTRNLKCVALGWGHIVAVGGRVNAPELKSGRAVWFVAPFHPRGVDEVCLHRDLVRLLPEEPSGWDANAVACGDLRADEFDWDRIAGWSDWSGRALDRNFVDELFSKFAPKLMSGDKPADLVLLPVEHGDARAKTAVAPSDSGASKP